MTRIKYIDEDGKEHSGTLSAWEYFELPKKQRVPYFSWHNTDYKPFLKAVSRKYKTNCKKAWFV